MRDLRFALRQLAKSPAFTATAILTLAVGIGSAAVVFSSVNALFLKPLPFLSRDVASRLLFITETASTRGIDDLGWTYGDFHALQERTTTLAGLWAQHDRTVILTGQGMPERHIGTELSWHAFSLLGVRPLHGRTFDSADAVVGAPEVALISYGLWQRKFGGKLEILGKSARLNGQPTTIIGIMPKGWMYPDRSDIWTPLRVAPARRGERANFHLSARALLKPGVTLEEAQAEANTIFGAMEREFPATNADVGVRLRPIREEGIEGTERYTILLFGAVMFVFLIACVNVANLLLARGVARAKEFAIRLALGAPQQRLVRQLLTESLVLALLGGLGGLISALWGIDAIVAAIPIEIPFWLRFELDGAVFAFVFGLALIAALTFGLLPALRTTRPELLAELRESGRGAEATGPHTIRLRNALVTGEIALALVLLVGAGLMLRSFFALRSVPAGFDPTSVFTFRTGYPPAMVDDEKVISRRFFAELLPRLGVLPGVESAGVVSVLPGNPANLGVIVVEGHPEPERLSDGAVAHVRSASAGYFASVRILLKAGRLFDETLDRPDTPRVAVVDEAFAARYFGSNEAALGKRVRLAQGDDLKTPEWQQIIGVVGNMRHRLDEPDLNPTLYSAHAQEGSNFMSIVMRTRTDPAGYENLARDTVLTVDRNLPIYDAFTLEEVLLRNHYIWPRKFFGYLFAGFGGVALFLACIGIYGVMSYNVSQRTQELGVRMALGASPREVISLVVRHGVRLIGVGLAAGFIAAVLLANLLTGLLYGISPHDPPTFAAVPLLLALVALIACWIPSRRATLIEPNAALRS